MEEYKHFFGCGVEMKIVEGEDGYTVNFSGLNYVPKIGTFTDFKNLLYGIREEIQAYSDIKTEIEIIAIELDTYFDKMDSDEIEKILLNYE